MVWESDVSSDHRVCSTWSSVLLSALFLVLSRAYGQHGGCFVSSLTYKMTPVLGISTLIALFGSISGDSSRPSC